jgi:hypothetical protein
MFEVMILIPKADNDGNVFSADHDRTFEESVIHLIGGLTWRGSAEGLWASDGRIHRDAMGTLILALRSLAEGAKVGEIAIFAKTHYRQEALYLSFLGVSEII